eukprot:TRINITY_DN12592_c0_g1_i3.p1 TRINITY_DN12592_c0_g1~~TRINITY_DN12592_c0_g1_i3.p1  ORF type:complete len:376 (-),score=87.81 TRINITY_DN12592_c0_g1_i3:221-1348(-)
MALSGIRIVDLSRLLPGPFATQILADMGAEVIKVEGSDGGDYTRYYPPAAADGNSAMFHALNRGKKSVMLDLTKPADKEKFFQLLATADVLMETFRPGVMAKLGVSPKSLSERFPSLIICSISGYGQTGPDALKAGHDLNYLARAGVLGMMKAPCALPVQVADIAGGSFPAAMQILAALYQRSKTGKGCVIDVSMTDWAHSLLVMAHSRHAVSGEPIGKGVDWLGGAIPCYDVYKTADGHIAVGALEPKFWKALCKALNLPDLKDKQALMGEEGQAVRQQLQQVLSSKTSAQWEEFFAPLDVMVEIIRAPEDAVKADRQLAARNLTLPVTIQDQKYTFPRIPLQMGSISERPSTEGGPQLGQHTESVFKQLRSRL